MTAPAAPVIHAIQTGGGNIRVRWHAVDDATDYNVYLGDTPSPTGLEAEISEAEVESDGSFIWWSAEEVGFIYVRVTALNSLAEESAYSNERSFYMNASNDIIRSGPTPALDHVRKGA